MAGEIYRKVLLLIVLSVQLNFVRKFNLMAGRQAKAGGGVPFFHIAGHSNTMQLQAALSNGGILWGAAGSVATPWPRKAKYCACRERIHYPRQIVDNREDGGRESQKNTIPLRVQASLTVNSKYPGVFTSFTRHIALRFNIHLPLVLPSTNYGQCGPRCELNQPYNISIN